MQNKFKDWDQRSHIQTILPLKRRIQAREKLFLKSKNTIIDARESSATLPQNIMTIS